MKKLVHIALLLVFTVSVAYAQPGKRMERIHAIKVAYITDKIQLTEEQSQRFWPVYNRYEDEMMSVRRQYMQNRRMEGKMDDEASMRSIDDDIELQEKILSIRKHYKDEFLKVISPKQLSAMIEAERDFKKMLLHQLKEHRQGRMMR